MDKELKDNTIFIYKQKKLEATGRKAMLEKLRVDKLAEQAAEIQSIDANVVYFNNQIKEADKYLLKLSAEVVSIIP